MAKIPGFIDIFKKRLKHKVDSSYMGSVMVLFSESTKLFAVGMILRFIAEIIMVALHRIAMKMFNRIGSIELYFLHFW